LIAALNYSNICAVYYVGQAQGRAYVVMEHPVCARTSQFRPEMKLVETCGCQWARPGDRRPLHSHPHARADGGFTRPHLVEGDSAALEQLLPVVHGELRRIASRQLQRERADHTPVPTALVHELYLSLVKHRR
jgi:hypothetical protein